VRSMTERQADAVARLERDRDAWVATVGADGAPHLVPVTLCWYEQEILLATRGDRPLARNIASVSRVRVGLGAGEDVVLVDATAASVTWSEASRAKRAAFVRRAGWDPGQQPGAWVLLGLTPMRMRVWRTVAENVTGSVVMKHGEWLS
jgi:hypothetical protein